MNDDSNWYGIGFAITGWLTFFGSWIYCIATYGYLLGVGLGWLPSIIVAFIVAALWPVIVVVTFTVIGFFILFHYKI